MSWLSSIALSFDHKTADTSSKTRLYHRKHSGALMIQRPLYPEPRSQSSICHVILLYPPAGIAGGDHLTIALRLDQGSHAVITTPGAGKWYGKAGNQRQLSLTHRQWFFVQASANSVHDKDRSANSTSGKKTSAPRKLSVTDIHNHTAQSHADQSYANQSYADQSYANQSHVTNSGSAKNAANDQASQHLQAQLAARARLEWLPQESIVYNEANMQTKNHFYLTESSSLMTWDISVFGRKAYQEKFMQGHYHSTLEVYRQGRPIITDWVAQEAQSRWFTSVLGLAGQHVYGSFWAVPSLEDIHISQTSSAHTRQQVLTCHLDDTVLLLRQAIVNAHLPIQCTHNYEAINIRYLGSDVRRCFEAFYQLREVLRAYWWQLKPCRPRIWDT